MPDLRPKGIDLVWNLHLPPVLLLCPHTRGAKLTKLKVREPLPRRVALVLAEAETEIQVALVSVKTQTEIQTARVEIQTIAVSVQT